MDSNLTAGWNHAWLLIEILYILKSYLVFQEQQAFPAVGILLSRPLCSLSSCTHLARRYQSIDAVQHGTGIILCSFTYPDTKLILTILTNRRDKTKGSLEDVFGHNGRGEPE